MKIHLISRLDLNPAQEGLKVIENGAGSLKEPVRAVVSISESFEEYVRFSKNCESFEEL